MGFKAILRGVKNWQRIQANFDPYNSATTVASDRHMGGTYGAP